MYLDKFHGHDPDECIYLDGDVCNKTGAYCVGWDDCEFYWSHADALEAKGERDYLAFKEEGKV